MESLGHRHVTCKLLAVGDAKARADLAILLHLQSASQAARDCVPGPHFLTMSSATPKGQSGPVADHKPKSSLPPVAIFDTPVSKAISLGRPAVILAGCFIRLPALIEDPVSTLRTALPLVAAIQIVYAICCLPVAGSQQAKSSRKPRPGERRKQDASARNVVGVSAPIRTPQANHSKSPHLLTLSSPPSRPRLYPSS